MFLICNKAERKRVSVSELQSANFVAVYDPETRRWDIQKNRYGPDRTGLTESDFTDVLSEVMTEWAARSIKNKDKIPAETQREMKEKMNQIQRAAQAIDQDIAEDILAQEDKKQQQNTNDDGVMGAFNDISPRFFSAPTF